jgi:hypothetical protein
VNTFAGVLLLIGLMFVGAEVAATVLGKFAVLTRYTVLAIPIILLVVSHGLVNLKNRVVSYVLIGLLVAINLYFLAYYSDSAPKVIKLEGYEIAADVIKKYPITEEDVIIMPFGGKFLPKYFPGQKLNILPFEFTETYATKKSMQKVFEPELANALTRGNAYDGLKDYLGSGQVAAPFGNYIHERVIATLPKDRYMIVAVTAVVNSYTYGTLQHLVNSDSMYKKQPLLFMLSGKNTSDLLAIGRRYYDLVDTVKLGSWAIYIFKNSRIDVKK